MKFGIQLYGPAPVFRKDPEAFMKAAAGYGYRLLEPRLGCLADDVTWDINRLEVYAPLMEKYGFSAYSCQILVRDCEQLLPELSRLTKEYGIRQYVIPCPSPVSEEHYQRELPRLKKMAEELASFGAELLLHNAKDASCISFGNISAYEWLLKQGDGLLKAQVDVGFLLEGGIDPEAFLWRNQDAVRSLHYKDMKKEGAAFMETSLGKGCLDVTACFQFARAMEIPQIADQDIREDIMNDLRVFGAQLQELTRCRERTKSILCVLDTQTGALEEIREFDRIIEAPNWMKNREVLIYNSEGHIFRYDMETKEESMIETGMCDNCNNDHVLSPDNSRIAVSHCLSEWESVIYTLPITGGEPKRITQKAPSFLHGWSPDGTTLAYCGLREYGQGTEVDIYLIPAEGGEERRLTAGAGCNDGAEYSPDGEYIWFISSRTGRMQVFRMRSDGSEQEQMTDNERNNWFPHISPDGKKVVYLSYSKDGLDAEEHLPNMHVELWMMDSDGSSKRRLLGFFGGQGSINVNSWSQDSRRLALIVYELEHR